MNVQKAQLQALLDLLNESKNLRDGGSYEASEVESKARLMLLQIIESEGGADGEKTT